MEYNINGIIYFDKDKSKSLSTTFINDINELDEFKVLKKWLIFKQKPKSIEEIKILEIKIDLIIKKNIKNIEYNFNSNFNNNLNILDIENNIPECFYRYKSLLNGVIEL